MSEAGSQNIRHDFPLAAAWGAWATATVLLFAAVFAVPVIRARNTIVTAPEIAEGRAACVDRYNALVHQAKDDLTSGDRPAAVRLLRAAQAQLHICSVSTTQEVEAPFRN
jgi:hypothetical protein